LWRRPAQHESLSLGVSPRGSQALYRAVQAFALLEGRDYASLTTSSASPCPRFRPPRGGEHALGAAATRTDAGERILEEILTQSRRAELT
jgi:MoxR-like ATPase